MPLNLYRRHQRGCEARFPAESKTGEFEERKRGWKRCGCFIFATGTLSGKFKRRYTGKTNWDDAKAVAAEWEKAGSWDGEVTAPEPLPQPAQPHRVTIARAVKTFLAELHETLAFATHKKYRLLLKRFVEFSEKRGYVMMDQWEPSDVREFRTSWGVSPQTAGRNMSMVKPFFEYCVANKWLTGNPARMVKNPRGRDASEKRGEQKLPFTDDELTRMYAATKKYPNTYRHKVTGDDLADFISLSVYTGLRISDVALFHIDRLRPNGEIVIRTTKAGTHVCTWVPQWLQDRITARAKQHGPLIFGAHTTKSLDVITDIWRRKLNKVWDLCDPWKEKPPPHRFRHTLARILLQKPGVTVRDVAELLGNTEEMIRKHYGAWVPERQARLTKILQEAFEGKPKLVAIDGGRG